MKNKLIVVITRAYLPRGHEHDEFVLWYRKEMGDEAIETDALLLHLTPRIDLLILHGCLENFMEPDPGFFWENIPKKIETSLETSIEFYREIHVLLHDPGMDVPRDKIEEIAPNIIAIYLYSSMDGEYIFSALEKVDIPEEDKEKIFSYFADLLKEGWQKYLGNCQSIDEIRKGRKIIRFK